MADELRDVVVVGGGISGLTHAFLLNNAGVNVCLLEAAAEVGGCTRTEQRDGFLLEKGPFNVMVRDPSFQSLIETLADEVEVVPASRAARARYIYRHRRLHPVPSNPLALATTRLLSVGGRCRLVAGLFLSRRVQGMQETIEQVATRRLGRQACDALVSAAISGIFAGDIRKLCLAECFPSVGKIDAEARSLIGYGLSRGISSIFTKKNTPRRRWRGLVSIDGGLGALTAAMGKRLGANLLTESPVDQIRKVPEGYEVIYGNKQDLAQTVRCRTLVIASPAEEAARLLQPLLPEAAADARSIESSSLAVLSLGFRAADVLHPMEGFGFLVPHDELDFPLMGVLWADSIFPHHAPPGHRLVRVFIGGARDPGSVNRTDEELIHTAKRGLGRALGLSGEPMLTDVCRYPSAIPQYYRGHGDKISRLRGAVATLPGLHLIGNYLEGVSLNDCVRLATRVAQELIESSELIRAPRASAGS